MKPFSKILPKPHIALFSPEQKSAMQWALQAMMRTLYPPRCMLCETLTDAPHGLCADCWCDTRFINGSTCITCGTPLVGEAEGEPCDTCIAHPPPWQRGIAVLEYDGTGRAMVLALKRHDRLDLAPAMAQWMQRAGTPLLATTDILAPVPLHPARLLRRKFNQSAELGRHIARLSGVAHIPDLLTRTRRTAPQQGKDRAARIVNLKSAIIPTPRHLARLAGKRVLLIDDVLTTGATLSACTSACYAAGAKNVSILVLARVEPWQNTSIFTETNIKD
ncbi:MAG: ComF family protein [Rhodobacteraceae bacterium]|nr:ComF family protein [Paracoccaceae bacterium]